MSGMKDRKWEVTRNAAEFREPASPESVQGDSPSQDRSAPDSGASGERDSRHEKPKKKRGRPVQRWRLRVVRIDAAQYPQFQKDRDHPFMALSVRDRNREIDSFLARLRVRSRKTQLRGPAEVRKAA